MLKFEDQTIAPGYVSFSENTLTNLDVLATEFAGDALEPLSLSRFADELTSIGHNCGQLLRANVDSKIAQEIHDQLTSNMNPDLTTGFSVGFQYGLNQESLAARELGVIV